LKGIEMSRSLKIYVVFMNSIFASFWIADYARRGLLALENTLPMLAHLFVVNVIAIPLMIMIERNRMKMVVNQPVLPKLPKELPTTHNKTILEAEHHWLVEAHLEDIHNLHELTRINLGLNQIRTINLSPLAGSTSLKELILYMNHLESIDLSPLASCPNLEYLDLTDNNLETIDLTPLTSCLKLEALNIGINKTAQLDLSPLSGCSELKILTIDGMKLKEIDLSPLRNCVKLELLKVDSNEIITLDITPLFECEKLTEFNVDRIVLTSTLMRDVEEWPMGIRKHKKKFR
jgi:hypothetical protein